MERVTVVGGGIGGLIAAIAARESRFPVDLLEARPQLGGRARSSPGPYVANWGPHALYRDGEIWRWLRERDLLPPCVKPPLRKALVMRWKDELHRIPPMDLLAGLARTRRKQAPIDSSYAHWVTDLAGPEPARALANAAGVFTFDSDPGRLSAAFVHERLLRVLAITSPARFVVGGWSALVDRLERRARDVGVHIETGVRIDIIPESPVVLALSPAAAARLLDDPSLTGLGTRTALLDLGIVARRGDPYILYDLDTPGWVETYTYGDPSLAPPGEHLVQAQVGLRAGESLDAGVERIETLLDAGFPAWRDRERWRRRAVIEDESGALDLPGTTWRDRPSVDRGEGVYLVGDMVAAPGLLSEVTHASALHAIEALTATNRQTSVLKS